MSAVKVLVVLLLTTGLLVASAAAAALPHFELHLNEDKERCISDHATQGPCSSTALCCTGCCSRYGYCGTTPEHCGDGCQSTCTGNPNPPSNEAVSWDVFYCGYKQNGPSESRLRTIHAALNAAVAKMGIKFGESISTVEVAAFLGQVSHESDYLKATREYCSLPEYGSTCLEHYDHGSWCPDVQPAPGKHYYGRGFMQLTWNCNYNEAGKGLGRNLLADPDQVETSDQVAWETALWFWAVNGIDVPARNGQFGETTNKINGALECNGGNQAAQQSRVNRYQTFRQCEGLGLEYDNNKLYC